MISLKLWRSLRQPPRQHPLFQQVLTKAYREIPQITSSFFAWGIMFFAVLFIMSMLISWLLTALVATFMLFNSIYAARWVLRIARNILEEKSRGRYDLLAVMPYGIFGAIWAISTGCVHQRLSFRWLPYLINVIMIIGFITLCGLSTLTLSLLDNLSANDIALLENLRFSEVGIIASAFLIGFYIDHIYSILVGLLVAQVTSVDRQSQGRHIWGLLVFLTVQVMTYAISLVCAMYVIPYIARWLALDTSQRLIAISVASLGIYILLRELTVRSLWYRLIHLVQADAADITFILNPYADVQLILNKRASLSQDIIG